MNENDFEKRIYVGECGSVRIESKHFRVTMAPLEFVNLLRRAAAREGKIPSFCRRLKISNRVGGSIGFVSIQYGRQRGK